ncbi:MAG: ADP-ribosylglycohydrolase family protein [Candidatus Woesearchaeota archaeon]
MGKRPERVKYDNCLPDGMDSKLKDRITGCIIGGAIGDALGMPVEGISHQDRFNFGRITKYESPKQGTLASRKGLKAGYYTDDTQMLIQIMKSIIKMHTVDFVDIAEHFRVLYESRKLRLAGRTTQLALKNLYKNIDWKKSGVSDGAGNNPATRVAPIALFSRFRNLRELSDCIFYHPIITHKSDKAIDGSAVILYAIRELSWDDDYFSNSSDNEFLDGLARICHERSESIVNDTMANRLIELKELLKKPEHVAITELRTTGYILDSVQSALYFFLRYKHSFESAVLSAVNNSYDADSIGAITGNLSGVYLGIDKIPMKLRVGLENYHDLFRLAEQFYEIISKN